MNNNTKGLKQGDWLVAVSDLPEKHITIRKDYQVDKVLDDETIALFGNQHTYTHVGINHFERG